MTVKPTITFSESTADNMFIASYDATEHVNEMVATLNQRLDDAFAAEAIKTLRPWLLKAGWTPPTQEEK